MVTLEVITFSFLLICLAKDCGSLLVPLNGSKIGNGTKFTNKVSFYCDQGFILHGSVLRTCEANGFWSGFQTTCKGSNGRLIYLIKDLLFLMRYG